MENAAGSTRAEHLLIVGRIIRAHGVRGELKVVPETEEPGRWQDLDRLYVGRSAEHSVPHEVESLRPQQTKRGPLVLVKLTGVDSRDDAMSLRKQLVFADQDDLPPLEEGEFFVHELVGARVITEDGMELGEVDRLINQPAHDVFVVRRSDGGTVMIPAVEAFVEDVDMNEHTIVVRPIEGLLE